MNDSVHRQRQREAEREVEQIRRLLRKHAVREYDPTREEQHYEGGFTVEAGTGGAPHYVGGFHVDAFRMWPKKMHQCAETLTAHGYQVEIRPYYDGEILEVTPPTKKPRRRWWKRLVEGQGTKAAT